MWMRRGLLLLALAGVSACKSESPPADPPAPPVAADSAAAERSPETIAQGREIFRHETFGDEQWGGARIGFTSGARHHRYSSRQLPASYTLRICTVLPS